MTITTENRISWADNLRFFATIAVVLLHATAKVQVEDKTITGWNWQIANLVESMVRFCVPVFLMLSGALILPKEYPLKDFLARRLVRIIFPFLFWTIVYIIFNYFRYDWVPRLSASWLSTMKWAVLQLLQGASFHMWYVYTLIGIYMFMPIIGKWLRSCTDKEISYFLLIWFFTLFFNLPHFAKFWPAVDLTYFSGYLGYVVLGYYLSRRTFNYEKKTLWLWILMILAGIIITLTGTYLYSARSGAINDTFYQYLTPNVMIVSVGIFMLFKTTNKVNNSVVQVVVNTVCKYSYGIYLAHPFVLFFLYMWQINWKFINIFIGIPVTTMAALGLSTLLVYLVSKLPYGKYISG